MIEPNMLCIFEKSGNEVRTLQQEGEHMGKPMWTVERTKGDSAGKQMSVPARSLTPLPADGATYAAGDVPSCPHCGKREDDPVEDYVVHGHGRESTPREHECGYCYKSFSVAKVGDRYQVRKA